MLARTLRILLAASLLFGCAVFSPTATPQPTAVQEATGLVASATVPAATATPEITIVAAPTATQPPSAPALTEDMLKNFTYSAPYTPDSRLPLQNGQFQINDETQNPPVRVFSGWIASAFGDLNSDGAEDAVVVLSTNTGGSGNFYDLFALLNQNGTPLQIASSGIGDRQMVKGLRIEDGRIILDYMTQGPQDGACCPNQHNLRTYVLEGGLLSLTSEQVLESEAAQATPLPTRIYIDRPTAYEQILGNIIEVRGRISQTPPSGTLTYHVLDIDNNLVMEGTTPVSGAPGQTGTFLFQVTLDSSVKYMVTIEVIDAENGLLRGRTPVIAMLPTQ